MCKLKPEINGRFRAVLLHYQGNTSGEHKNLPEQVIRRLCNVISEGGFVPVILDWDFRTTLADGKTIHNPNANTQLWGDTGTGDAEVLAALIDCAFLMVGVDSGPLHVAGATSTPTLGIWTGHHPLHYFGLADQVTHLVPEQHQQLLRGNREAGEIYFRKNYHYQTYTDLEGSLLAAVKERLQLPGGNLVHTRNFWVRADNLEQDLVVVQDIAEDDSYQTGNLVLSRPVVVDVGAHIGCFSCKIHERFPEARIIAVECCPENLSALRKNVEGIATVVPAAVTYEQEVALLNAVFPNCVTTGGSTLISRKALEQKVAAGELGASVSGKIDQQYWADFRPLQAVTLESILEEHGLDRIDVLKLDCEGSEFSILRNTTLLDRIGIIVGEYHGKEAFLKLIEEKFQGWELRVLKDGELGLFWLSRPARQLSQKCEAASTNVRRQKHAPVLVAALHDQPTVGYSLLFLDQGKVIHTQEHTGGLLRGFAKLGGKLWTIDSSGSLYHLGVDLSSIAVTKVATSLLAWEAHGLTVVNGCLATASPRHNAIVLYDPKRDEWSVRRPWVPIGESAQDQPAPYDWDQHHVNSIVHDGENYFLSLFSRTPKQAGPRGHTAKLDAGVILRWGNNGFGEQPLASGLMCPHSLRLYRSQVWWCNSFRGLLCRDDGWQSPPLGGFARGLAFEGNKAIVGLSKFRVNSLPRSDICGLCIIDLDDPSSRVVIELDKHFSEIYDILPLLPERLA